MWRMQRHLLAGVPARLRTLRSHLSARLNPGGYPQAVGMARKVWVAAAGAAVALAGAADGVVEGAKRSTSTAAGPEQLR